MFANKNYVFSQSDYSLTLELETTFLDEEGDNGFEFLKIDGVDITSVSNSFKESRVVGSHVFEELLFELQDFRGDEDIEVLLDTSEDDADLFFSLHGSILVLL